MKLFVFKCKKQFKTINSFFRPYVYVKIENNRLYIKSDLTNFKYISIEEIITTFNKKDINKLIEFNNLFNNMQNSEKEKYLEKEFDKMNYELIAKFD